MIISPSLLAANFLSLKDEIEIFKDSKDLWLHLDIMDGHFVPNLTFGHAIVSMISKATSLPLDVHLMVSNPLFYIKTFKDYNIHNLTFHVEATDYPKQILETAKKIYPSVGISLKPNTHQHILDHALLDLLDLVLVMSVQPGFGGQQFMEGSLEKVLHFSHYKKKHDLTYQIQVDGGISSKNASNLLRNGAHNLVVGSYLFNNSPQNYLKKIKELINN